MTVLKSRARQGSRVSVTSLANRQGPLPVLLSFPSPSRFSWLDVGYATYFAARLRLPRNAVGACARPARRDRDLPGADARSAVVVGNPAVYPPIFVLASVPLALLPFSAAAWYVVRSPGSLQCSPPSGSSASAIGAVYALAVDLSRRVLHGALHGNLTVLLVPPTRHRLALPLPKLRIVGIATGLRDRRKAVPPAPGRLAADHPAVPRCGMGGPHRLSSSSWGAWAVVGLRGASRLPVAATSPSRTSMPCEARRSRRWPGALRCFRFRRRRGGRGRRRWYSSEHPSGRRAGRRATAARSRSSSPRIVASPIVWPNYAALLLVPIAVTWPRLGPFGSSATSIWLAGALAPDHVATPIRLHPAVSSSRPDSGVTGRPAGWIPAAMCLVVGAVGLAARFSRRHR